MEIDEIFIPIKPVKLLNLIIGGSMSGVYRASIPTSLDTFYESKIIEV